MLLNTSYGFNYSNGTVNTNCTGYYSWAGNQRSNCQHTLDHRKSKQIPKKTSTSASLTSLKPLTVWITTNWKILKEMWIPDHVTCLLGNLYACQEATARTRHGPMNWLKFGKRVYCHPAHLSYMQSTLCKMTGWMTHKLGSGLLGKILTTSDMHIIQL